jgi:3-oxoacyl-[acyl-carrier protein] reductase
MGRLVVIVTGAGSGIGLATARSLAARGACVTLCGRRGELLVHAAALVAKDGGEALPVVTDVRSREQVARAVAQTLEQWGRIDALVNNAGVAHSAPIVELAESQWDAILETNLKGTFLCCQAVLPAMLARSAGVIVNVASTLGLRGAAGLGAYSASKFAVIGLTQALADELGGAADPAARASGVRVHAVCPGATWTPLHRALVGEQAAVDAMLPSAVGDLIVALITGERPLSSGAAVVLDRETLVDATAWAARSAAAVLRAARWLRGLLARR